MKTLLQTDRLDVQAGDRLLIDGLDLRIQAGQCWVVMGRNGSGKTRLLHTLAGLGRRDAAIKIQDQPLHALNTRERARQLGLLLQHSDSGMHSSTLQLVLGGTFARGTGWENTHDIAQAQQVLHAVGLGDAGERLAASLSGGELRRAEIARLLLQSPSLAMLDEPLNHLDLGQQVAILELLVEHFTRAGRALLLVLHDVTLALRVASHLLLLHGDGHWQAGERDRLGDSEQLGRLFGYPLREYSAGQETIIAPDLGQSRLGPGK